MSREKRGGWFLLSLALIILFAAGLSIWYIGEGNNSSITKTKVSETVGANVTKGELEVSFGASELNISSSNSSDLVSGDISSFATPSISQTIQSGTEKVVIDQVSEGSRLWVGNKGNNSINLQLTESLPLSVAIKTGASKLNLDFTDIKLENLSIDSGASSSEIRIGGETSQVNIQIKSGASSFRFHLLKNSGVKVTSNSALTGNNFSDIGLIKNVSTYQSENYDTATQKINIALSTGVSSVNLELY